MNEVIAESILQKITDKKTSVFTIFYLRGNLEIYDKNTVLWQDRKTKMK